jgi:hypothetical protein
MIWATFPASCLLLVVVLLPQPSIAQALSQGWCM